MKTIRILTLIVGLLILGLAFGFSIQHPFATSLWPWPDGRYSYLFIGSILAGISAALLWIGWTDEWGALPAGSLNILVITLGSGIYLFTLATQNGRLNLLPHALLSFGVAIASGISFFWSRQIPINDSRPIPPLVRVSFGIFIVVLFFAGGDLILRAPIFPWKLNPDSSIIFGLIFVGDAFYFLYSFFQPRWHHATGQLLSFLAYDVVLIGPFLSLSRTVQPEYFINLVVYVAVLIYSGGLAVFYLLIHTQTRFGS